MVFTSYLDNPSEHNCFNFSIVTENEIAAIINNLNSKISPRKDEISNILLNSIKGEISKPLTIITYQCLATGIFPKTLNVAKVNPLYKKADNCCFNNYRPISLLPTISKKNVGVICLLN